MVDKIFGVDFGSTGIKLVEVKIHKGIRTVEKQAFLPLDPGTIVDGAIAPAHVDTVAAALKALITNEKFTAKRVIMGINSLTHVYVNRAITKYHEPKEYADAIAFDVLADKTLILGAPDGCIINPIVYRDFEDPRTEERKVDALLCAVASDIVERQAEVLKKAGLVVVGSDLAAFAGLRALKLTEREPGYLDLIVDIGHDVLSVLIHGSGIPYSLTLEEKMAGSAAAMAIQSHLQDDDRAVLTRAKVSPVRDFAIDPAIDQYTDRAARAIQKAYENYTEKHPGNRLSSVTLIGGGSRIREINDAIERALDAPVFTGMLTPEIEGQADMFHDDGLEQHDYTVAIGLAMGAAV